MHSTIAALAAEPATSPLPIGQILEGGGVTGLVVLAAIVLPLGFATFKTGGLKVLVGIIALAFVAAHAYNGAGGPSLLPDPTSNDAPPVADVAGASASVGGGG